MTMNIQLLEERERMRNHTLKIDLKTASCALVIGR